MRFAYIDSHGNEVPIPSVDALALRIELGAIGPETQLYDAQADHWGPASSHEIFHTLSREGGSSDGFVAPPPVAPPPPVAAPAAPAEKPARPKPPAKPKPEAKPKAEPAKPKAADLGLTLAEPAPPPPPPKVAPPPDTEPAAGSLDLSLDLAPPSEAPKKKSEPLTPPGEGLGTFDYGDLGAGLQLEDSTADAGPLAGFGGGMSTEPPMQFGGGGGGGELQLEQPMSAFTPDSPPGWMAESEPAGAPALDFSAASAAPAADAPAAPVRETTARPKREPKDKPSAPKFKSRSSISATPIILTVLVLALGVGGYVAWPMIQARLFPPPPPPPPAMVMPALSPELMPRMRELAQGAIADVVAEVDRTTGSGVPAEPDQLWLSGRYLADASQFANIEAFWTGMATFLDGVRAADWQGYHDRMLARSEDAGLGDDAAAVVERADSGFVAATEERAAVYATLDGVIQAALDLHDFLVQNEANIEYRPASTSTADPILEAVPSSPAIGNQMLEMVDRITDGLAAHLGTLDRATRARMTSALTTRLQEVGIE